MVNLGYSPAEHVRATMHGMSNFAPGEAERAGALLEDAIAALQLEEMKNQRYRPSQMQTLSGVKSRSWANYYVSRDREIPTWAWVSVGRVLGMTEVEVIRRAKALVDSLDAEQLQLMALIGGKARVGLMRDMLSGRGEVEEEDPPDDARGGRRSA